MRLAMRYSKPTIVCRKMNRERQFDALFLLDSFLRNDAHYLTSSGAYGDEGLPALKRAIKLFLNRPELGFVWLAYAKREPAGVCVVSYAISTSIGGLVAKLDDVYVSEKYQKQGIATKMLKELCKNLKRKKIRRIDTSVHKRNRPAANIYARLGFKALEEERLALVL
jgi:ribosomal protein S18 acetylase RimI-like enzyme